MSVPVAVRIAPPKSEINQEPKKMRSLTRRCQTRPLQSSTKPNPAINCFLSRYILADSVTCFFLPLRGRKL
jgi:hypothetical protein